MSNFISFDFRMLTTHYDTYKTLSHILDTFSNTTEEPAAGFWAFPNEVTRSYGQSLFKTIPSTRQCREIKISEPYCPCAFPVKLPADDIFIQLGAHEAIRKINSMIPDQCAQLQIKKLLGGAVLSKINEETSDEVDYVVKFVTSPGDFVLEVRFKRKKRRKSVKSGNKGKRHDLSQFDFEVDQEVQRLTKFNTDVSCIEGGLQQLYCFCKNQNSS